MLLQELFTASRAEPTGVPGGLLNGCNAPEVQAVAVLRAEQYPELHNQGNVYLDYTGGGLAARKQVQSHLVNCSCPVQRAFLMLYAFRSAGQWPNSLQILCTPA